MNHIIIEHETKKYNMSTTTTTSPPCKVLLRSKDGVELYTIPERPTDPANKPAGRPFILKGATTICQVDANNAFLHVAGEGIFKCSLTKHSSGIPTRPFFADTQNVQMMDISPKGNYLLTWERFYEDKRPDNLRVWETATGRLAASFTQKALKREAWPNLQWTADEAFAALHTTNEVRFFPAPAFAPGGNGRFVDKLRADGIASLSLPRQIKLPGLYFFTTFCPGDKNKPARAGFYQYIPGMKVDAPPLLSKSLFQAEEMKAHWNAHGDGALITLQTSVDASGESYYGSSQLFLLRKDSAEPIAVPLPQEGTVLDVAWVPDPSKPPSFVVLAGKMPAMASLHHGMTGKATFLYGNSHRNTVAWSPHGRFLLLAGFGNLAGGMSFWDNNKGKLTAGALNVSNQLRAEAVVSYGWSPDSRVFLCSTCSPRMNVDNGARLFRYNGEELMNVPWENQNYRPDRLLGAVCIPAPTLDNYPDRPQTPPPEGLMETVATAAPANTAPAPKPAGRYVPPSARGKGGGASLAERMRRETEGKLQTATRVVEKPKNAQGNVVVGLANADSGKSKSAMKREKQKKKQEEQAVAEAAAKAAAEAQRAVTKMVQPEASVDPEKRARKLKKTLKQIDDLKAKDPSTLNDDQKEKIASEEGLRKELADLGL